MHVLTSGGMLGRAESPILWIIFPLVINCSNSHSFEFWIPNQIWPLFYKDKSPIIFLHLNLAKIFHHMLCYDVLSCHKSIHLYIHSVYFLLHTCNVVHYSIPSCYFHNVQQILFYSRIKKCIWFHYLRKTSQFYRYLWISRCRKVLYKLEICRFHFDGNGKNIISIIFSTRICF